MPEVWNFAAEEDDARAIFGGSPIITRFTWVKAAWVVKADVGIYKVDSTNTNTIVTRIGTCIIKPVRESRGIRRPRLLQVEIIRRRGRSQIRCVLINIGVQARRNIRRGRGDDHLIEKNRLVLTRRLKARTCQGLVGRTGGGECVGVILIVGRIGCEATYKSRTA